VSTDELDLRLHRLARDGERAKEALLELELDPTRELLDGAALAGATATAWTAASSAVALAWEGQELLEGHLEQLRTLRASRSRLRPEQLLEFRDGLDGPALAVPGEPGARCAPAELLARSSAAVAEARRVIAAVAQTWDALVPRLTTASATLRACAELLDELGVAHPPDIDATRRELARLTGAVAQDPLAVDPQPVGALEAAVASVRADAERLRDFRADADRRLDQAATLLAEAHRADEEAREAHRVALAKIAAAELPEPAALPAGLAGGLDAAVTLARSGAWREADEALERWTRDAARARDAARRAAEANHAPLALRDELRGRLGAYQAKARALRLLEEPELAALHERARRVLHTAPTDLTEAARLVSSYRQRLSERPESEVPG
jgi:hypothetical protein